MSDVSLLLLCAVFVFVLMGTVLIIEGVRKVPVQHARRIIGRREVLGGGSYLPLKVNYAGVIPVIFASSLLVSACGLAFFAANKKLIIVFSQNRIIYSTNF